MPSRRALVIGVGEFDAGFQALPFAVELAQRIADVLTGYQAGGFSVRLLTDPDRDEISHAVREFLDDTSVQARVIHLVSHGRFSTQADRVEVVGRCTRVGNNVRDWASEAQDATVPTLFLVDLCGAGKAADLRFSVEPREDEVMAWVLAGARGDEKAFDGAFTRAAVQVLEECGRDGLGTDPRLPFVSLHEVARRISDRLHGQSLWTTKVPLHYGTDLPILPNPRHVEDPVADQVAALEAPLQPFLSDVVADATHFQLRAGTYFTGRQEVLDTLVPWIDGTGPGGLRVVTGAAGSGKSAILGALVCASHPALQQFAGPVRRRMADPPRVNPSLVAVHARQRSLAEIVASIGRQLDLPEPADGWTAAALIDAITGRDEPPTVIVDALDECVEAGAVQALLLMPLAIAVRGDGRPVSRLLVGTRPWRDRFTPLLEHAATDRLTDLDQLDRRQLYRDLRRYLLDLFDGVAHDERLAEGIAACLADDHERRRGDPAASRWGAFLVAGRYARYVLDQRAAEDVTVDALLAGVPVDLPQVLEMELAAHPRPHHLRAALAALAYAKGDGMPVELLRVVATALGPADPDLFTGDDVRLYLRTSSEASGVGLLRLYHEGLADHLRAHPITSAESHDLTGPVAAALVGTRDVGDGTRSWEHAPGYLLRHGIQHAADAGIIDTLLTDFEFLVHAQPGPLLMELDHAESPQARLGAAIYRTVHHSLNTDAERRRRLLTITALRHGTAPGAVPGTLIEPRWATGNQLSPALRRSMTGHTNRVETVACTRLDGRPVAVTSGEDRTIRIWDLTTGQQIGAPMSGHTKLVGAVACTILDDRTIAVTGSGDATVRVWDLTTGQQIGAPLTGHTSPVTAVACTELDGRPVAVTGGEDTTVRIWDLTTGQQIGAPLTGHTSPVTAVACTELDGRTIAVTSGEDTTVRIWDLTTGQQIGAPLTGHTSPVTAVACTELDGRPVAVTGGWDRRIRIWDLATGQQADRPLIGHTSRVEAVACIEMDGRPVAVTGGLGRTVRAWDLTTGQQICAPLTGHTIMVAALACTELDGRTVVVTGSWDRTVRLWDLTTARAAAGPPPGHTGVVEAVACTELDGRPVAVTGGRDARVWVWDLATGQQVGAPLAGHTGPVNAVACTEVNGRRVAVTGSWDKTVRVWDLATGRQIGAPLTGHSSYVTAVACTELNGRPVAVTGSGVDATDDVDTTVRVWDLATGRQIGAPLTGHNSPVNVVACTELDGRPIAITGSGHLANRDEAEVDRTVRVWDLTTGRQIGAPLTGHTSEVNAVACTELNGRRVAVTGSWDRTVRIWDLATGRQINAPLTGHTSVVSAVVCTELDGRPIAITGGFDDTVRVWDLQRGECLDVWPVWDSVSCLALGDAGRSVIVPLGWDLVSFALVSREENP